MDNSMSGSVTDLESPVDRRMTRVLQPGESQYANFAGEDVHPRCPSPRPETLCKMVQAMTNDQVQELLHRMNINDDSSQDEEIVMEQADEKSQEKPGKKKAPAKKVVKGNNKSNKTDLQVQNGERAKPLVPPVEDLAPEEIKVKKTKRGKKDNAVAESVSVTSDQSEITSNSKKDLEEEIVVKHKKKGTKVKQNSAKEVSNEDQSLESVHTQESDINNDEKGQESEISSKTKKSNKKTKQTENAHVEKQKETDKKQLPKAILNEIEKGKPGKPLKKSKGEDPVAKEDELSSEIKNIADNKPTRTGRGKQKIATEIEKDNNETAEKELESKTGEEPNKGRAKRNTKKGAKEVVEDIAIEPEVVKEVQKSKKKIDAKQKENQDPEKKNEPKNKPDTKTNPPTTKEKKPTSNKGGKTTQETAPATKRPTRKVVK